MSNFMIGFNLITLKDYGINIPIYVPPTSHLIIVGGSGSGKSTALLYFLYKLTSTNNVKLTICDFKASHEFIGISDSFAEFENCYDQILSFYTSFLSTPEGGNGSIQVLLIDEIAGLLNHLSMNKETKEKADKIRQIMSSILMLGRSKQCFLWLSMQRYTSSIFPASSGATDNFHVCIGLGRLTVDGRKGLFAGEHLENEEHILFKQGRGIVLIDGEPIKGLIIPKVSKQKLLTLLQERHKGGRSTP